MEQVALRIQKTDGWTYLGGQPEAPKPVEIVVRAFEGSCVAATGTDESAPEGDGVLVPEGEGRRLEGRFFFVRPEPPGEPVLISYRGI